MYTKKLKNHLNYLLLKHAVTPVLCIICAIISGYLYEYIITGIFHIDILKSILACIGCALLLSASYAVNQYYDIKIDKISHTKRELPKGGITLKTAFVLTVILHVSAFTVSFFTGTIFFACVIITMFFSFLYSYSFTRLKRFNLLSYTGIAFIRGPLIFVAGWSVAYENAFVKDVFIFSGILFLYLLFGIILKDIPDINGDKEDKIITFPVKYGIKKSINLIGISLLLPWVVLIIFGIINVLSGLKEFYIISGICFLIAGIIMMIYLKRIKEDDLNKYKKIFVYYNVLLVSAYSVLPLSYLFKTL